LRMEFYLFGQSMLNPKAFKLIQKHTREGTLEPGKTLEYETPEVVTAWDKDGAIFGAKYKGCYLLVFGADDKILGIKSTSSFLSDPTALPRTTEGNFYNHDLDPASE